MWAHCDLRAFPSACLHTPCVRVCTEVRTVPSWPPLPRAQLCPPPPPGSPGLHALHLAEVPPAQTDLAPRCVCVVHLLAGPSASASVRRDGDAVLPAWGRGAPSLIATSLHSAPEDLSTDFQVANRFPGTFRFEVRTPRSSPQMK